MISCVLYWLIFVLLLALVYFLVVWVLKKIVDLPEIVYQILGMILGIVALIRLLGCFGFVDQLWHR